MRITALVGATALTLSLTACGQAKDEPVEGLGPDAFIVTAKENSSVLLTVA